MASTRQSTGAQGEQIAVGYLQEAGLQIIERNWRCEAGEIDIVAEDQAPDYVSGEPNARWLVLVEVRTRRGQSYGSALQAFPQKKQAKLREVAGHYVQQRGWQGPWRIDAVAVQMNRQGKLDRVDHIRHAVTG